MRKSEEAEFMRLIFWLVAIVALIGVAAWAHDWWVQQGNVLLSEWRTPSYSSRPTADSEPDETPNRGSASADRTAAQRKLSDTGGPTAQEEPKGSSSHVLSAPRKAEGPPPETQKPSRVEPAEEASTPKPPLAEKPDLQKKAREATPTVPTHKPKPLSSPPKQSQDTRRSPVKEPPQPPRAAPVATRKNMDDKVAAMLADLRSWKSEPPKRARTTAPFSAAARSRPEMVAAEPAAQERAAAIVASAQRVLESSRAPRTVAKETRVGAQELKGSALKKATLASPDAQKAADALAQTRVPPVGPTQASQAATAKLRQDEAHRDTTTVKAPSVATLATKQAEMARTVKTILGDGAKPNTVPVSALAQETEPAKTPPPAKVPSPVGPQATEPADDDGGPKTARQHDQLRYHFDPLGRDRQILDPNGQPVTPEQVPALYQVTFAVYDEGLDVCSREYAAETAMPELKRPAYVDLSAWDNVRVPAGKLAIDPRLGRLQFSGGRPGDVKQVGRCHIPWGEARDVFVSGNYAYLATAESTYPVCIYDIADPATPVKVGMIKAGDMEWPTRVFVHQDRVFIPSRFRTLGVVDVSNVTEPRRLAQLTITDGEKAGVRSVAVSGEYAYLTIQGRGVAIWHIPHDAPSMGLQVAFIKIPAPFNPFAKPRIARNHLLLANGNRLLVYNVTNPEDPAEVAEVSIPQATNLQVRGDQAFIACNDGSFLVMDISDLKSPKLVGKCRPYEVEKGGLDDVALDGNFAHVSVRCRRDQRVCFVTIDISRPSQPMVVGKGLVDPASDRARMYDDPRLRDPFKHAATVTIDDNIQVEPTGIAAANGHVYVSDLGFGLWAFDVSDPQNPKLVGGAKESGEVSSAYIHGDRAYLAQNMLGGLSVLDISSPASPKQLSSYYTGTHVWACPSFRNEYVYFTGYASSGATHFHVLDVMAPMAPRLLHRRRASQDRSACVSSRGDQCLLFMDGQIISLDDPSNPKVLSQVPEVGKGWGLRQVALDDRLYLCRNTEFAVVDISDPQNPTKVGSLPLPSPGQWEIDVDSIRVTSGKVLIPHGDGGLLLIDISDESAPRIAAQCTVKAFKDSHKSLLSKLAGKLAGELPWSTGAIMSAEMVGSTVYVADYKGYIYEVASQDLKAPKVVGNTEFGRGLDVEGDYLYRATLDGLTVFGVPRPSEAPKGIVKTIAELR